MINPGSVIENRYKCESVIGRGGMGEVWRCEDLRLGRKVALKTVAPHLLASDPSALKILQAEAKTGARLLGHPHTVGTLDLGTHREDGEKTQFITMEFVEGVTAAEFVSGGQLGAHTYYYLSLYIGWCVCKAIVFAHRLDIIHRDLKPLNIFIGKFGRVKVGDFGISRFVDAITRTHTMAAAKTYAYAAPEQWRGERATKRTDVYQLGATLYQLFTKKLPFNESGALALMNAHLNETPQSPKDLVPRITEGVSKAISSALKKDPVKRIALWKLHDILAEELRGKYALRIDVSKRSPADQKFVHEVTDFDLGSLSAGPCKWNYPDFPEVLSEALELHLGGIRVAILRRS